MAEEKSAHGADQNGESGSERPFLEKKNFISGNKNFVDRRLFVYIKCKIFLAASPKK